jgi:hypothetical protein
VEESENLFKRELDVQKNVTSGEGSKKRRKYTESIFYQMLILLPHLEDHDMHSNLGTERNEHEEDANSSEEEEKKRSQNFRKKKRNEISYEEALLQILRQKKNGRFKCR